MSGEEPVVSAEEEQAAVAGGEGEALRSFLEVGNFGVLAQRSVRFSVLRALFPICRVLFLAGIWRPRG